MVCDRNSARWAFALVSVALSVLISAAPAVAQEPEPPDQLGTQLGSQSSEGTASGQDGAPIPEFRFDVAEYGDRWVLGDRNEDGITDYAVYLDEDNYKVREAVDHDEDGYMDDFYYYSNEVLQRQEVDTNYDQAIDLWVYMHRGVWVESYERDTDHDGEPDVVKNFDQSEQQ